MKEINRGLTLNLNDFTVEELSTLNRRVVDRIRGIRSINTQMQMYQFHKGERVQFKPYGKDWIQGMVTRLNQKTVTVITDCGQQWKVHPSLLEKLDIIEGEIVEEATGQLRLLRS